MTVYNVEELLKKLNLTDEAVQQINNIRASEPSRKVRSNGKNVTGFYPSRKMGVTIQFESHKLELAAIYEKEHDPNVLEYYDQPPSFPIKYKNSKGSNKKNIGHRYTADFFVIENDWIGWEEWKTDEDLLKLSQKYPTRYCVDEKGNWRCPPAEEYAKQLGLMFRVKSSKEIDWTYQRNLLFLEDYLLDEKPYVSEEAVIAIKKLLNDKPFITLDELLSNQTTFLADDIYTLIALEEIYVDLKKCSIVDFRNTPLFLNEKTYKAYQNMQTACIPLLLEPTLLEISVGAKVYWDVKLWTIINITENVISLLSEVDELSEIPKFIFEDLIKKGSIKGLKEITKSRDEQEVLKIIKGASEKELEVANRKYLIVQGMLNGGKYDDYDTSDRTIRDWIKKYKDAEKIYGNGYVGLISRRSKQGNRTERFPKEVLDLMNKYIEEKYEMIIQKNRWTVYNALKKECELKGYQAPCFKTFCNKVKARPIHLQTKKRKGSKASYDTQPFYYELRMTTPRHGDRPFEICHIDHTELDIELICSQTEENLGKPWITFLVDAFSRRILAFYLTFDPPSYRSCMMVLRECVRRHNRLPKIIIVDGGKEFHSVYFETLIARYGRTKKVRPGAKPKFGSVCERLFGTTNDVFIHNLLGNTKIMKNVRQVTKGVNPKIHAVWTLEDLYTMMEEWCYEIYDTMLHSSLNESPREASIKRITKSGERINTYIYYDETFTILTLPTTKKGTAKVIPGQGVKINYFYYWSEELLHPDIEDKQIPIRYDPYDLGVAYAYVNNYWITLTSQDFSILSNRTEKELKIATAEIRRRKKVFGLKKELSSSQIVDFLESAESYELLKKQRLKDNAVKRTSFKVFESETEGKNRETSEFIVENTVKENKKIREVNTLKAKLTYKEILDNMKNQNSFETYKEL